MRNKKGFTLIELLAVIVILAVIALITVPVVINIINNAKKGAAEDSAYGVIEAAKLYWVENSLEDTNNTVTFTYDNENKKWITVGDKELLISGTKPTGDNDSSITVSGGNVSLTNVKFNGYACNTNNEYKVVCEVGSGSNQGNNQGGNTTPQVTYAAYSVGDSINYNPVTNELCDSPVSTPGTKTGCMKWYVIKASGSNEEKVDVILDHNTTATVPYKYEQTTIMTQIDTDTTGWTNGLNPRLITADEIAAITGNDGWSSLTATSSQYFHFGSNNTTNYLSQTEEQKAKQRSLAWLVDYTDNCTSYGCTIADSSTSGYWTSSSVSDYPSYATWAVCKGYVYDIAKHSEGFGLRPVITITKTQIQV